MILLLSGILLIILLSRITEEALRIPFVLALILFSYGLRLSFPDQFAALGSNFDEILRLMLPIILLPDLLSLTSGEIIAQGNHEELMKSSPLYLEIYESQLGSDVLAGIDEASLGEEVTA